MIPTADIKLNFEVSGQASIIATDNGNPYDMILFKSNERSTLNSKALVVFKFHSEVGKITLKANSELLKSSELEIILKNKTFTYLFLISKIKGCINFLIC